MIDNSVVFDYDENTDLFRSNCHGVLYAESEEIVMRKRWMGVLGVVLCMMLTACGAAPLVDQETTVAETAIPEIVEESVVLDVYYLAEDVCAASLVDTYKMFYPEVELNVTAFSGAEEMDAQITNDAAVGDGADVILFHSSATTLDMMKMAGNGAFLDLAPMLEADGSYDPANYYAVLDAGVVDGMQALMPIRFGLSYFLTTEEKLEAADLDLPQDYTVSEWMQAIMAYADSCPQGRSAVYPNDLNVRNLGGYLYDALRLSGVSILNPEGRRLTMEEGTFREFSEFVKMEWLHFEASAKIAETYGQDLFAAYERVLTIAFGGSEAAGKQQWMRGGSLPWVLQQYSAAAQEGLNETVCLRMVPDYEDPDVLTADVYTYAAIPESTDVPEAAYAFVRYAMDARVLKETHELPVSRQATAALLDTLCEKSVGRINLGAASFSVPQMTEEMRRECEVILDRVVSGSISNNAVKAIFTETMTDYLTGRADLDVCRVNLENRLAQYLSE